MSLDVSERTSRTYSTEEAGPSDARALSRHPPHSSDHAIAAPQDVDTVCPQARDFANDALTSSEYKRRLFATVPRVRYGLVKEAQPVAARLAGSKDSSLKRKLSSDSNELTGAELRAQQSDELSVRVQGLCTALALPSACQYKAQLVLQTAEAVNHLRLGRTDDLSGVADALLKASARGVENAAWQVYSRQQLTPLAAAAAIFAGNLGCKEQLNFTDGALAGQTWTLQQLAALPKSAYTQVFGGVCLTYHATLESWYHTICNSTCPLYSQQVRERLTTLVVEHRALCFALTFLNYSGAATHNLWPALPEDWTPTTEEWRLAMEKVALMPEQLQLCAALRRRARQELTELEMCTSLIKGDVEARIQCPNLMINDVTFLDAVEALSDTHVQQLVVKVQVANELLFEILTPAQAAMCIAALQVDVAKRPIYAWLDWIRLLASAVSSSASVWIDGYTCG